MKKCPNCGAWVSDSLTKCNSCDRTLPADLEPVPAAAPVIEEAAAPAIEDVAAPAIEDVAAPAIEDVAAPAIEEAAAPAIEEAAAPVIEEATNTSSGPTPVLELGDDTYVQPPVFPEEEAAKAGDIHLTLGEEETPVVPPVYPEPPVNAPEGQPGPQTQNTTPPPAGEPAKDFGYSQSAPGQNASYQGGAGQSGQKINLTQQAINEQKQKQQYRQTGTSYSYQPAGDPSVTGTVGLVLGIVGLVLVVVFGAIGSCTGVAGFSFILTIIGLVISIVGLIKSNQDKKRSGGTCARANAGFVLSLIGIIIGALLLIIGLSCVGCIGCMACSAAGAMVP